MIIWSLKALSHHIMCLFSGLKGKSVEILKERIMILPSWIAIQYHVSAYHVFTVRYNIVTALVLYITYIYRIDNRKMKHKKSNHQMQLNTTKPKYTYNLYSTRKLMSKPLKELQPHTWRRWWSKIIIKILTAIKHQWPQKSVFIWIYNKSSESMNTVCHCT